MAARKRVRKRTRYATSAPASYDYADGGETPPFVKHVTTDEDRAEMRGRVRHLIIVLRDTVKRGRELSIELPELAAIAAVEADR